MPMMLIFQHKNLIIDVMELFKKNSEYRFHMDEGPEDRDFVKKLID